MAEVQDWSPVDDDNDSAPPVGAPEGMMPSAVNNTLRAMMGSLRRMYDKIVSAETVLPYLPLAGGTVTGNVAINGTGGVSLLGVQLRNIGSGLEVYHAGAGGVSSRGAGACFAFGDRDQVSASWQWFAQSGQAYLYNAIIGNVIGISPAGRLTAVHSVDTQRYDILGITFAQRSGAANAIYDGDGQLALVLNGAAGGNTNYYRADTHNFQNNAGGGVFNIDSAGAVNTGSVSASGNVAASGNVMCVSVGASGNITAGDGSTHGNITSTYPGQFIGNACDIANGVFATLTSSSVQCNGNINAASYTRNGVPVFTLTEAQFDILEARIAHLETQLKERSYV